LTTLGPLLLAASSAIILTLGLLHLAITFHGPKLFPRDRDLQKRMTEVSPVITRETTMWKTWIGFNASHSFGAMLFGAVYGYLALLNADFLFASTYLLALGAATLAGYVFLGKRYFFSVPYRGILAAGVLYAAALIVRWTGIG
jgi:hypothetical protein